MDEQKILLLASRLVMAGITQNSEGIKEISSELAAELQLPIDKKGDGTSAPSPHQGDFIGFLKFTKEEISEMPTQIRKTFRAEGCTVHYRKRIRGINSCSYEARYRRHGYNISVSATTLIELKRRFIDAFKNADKIDTLPSVPRTFHEFATYYFDHFWKRKVTNQTYRSSMYRYENHIRPYFGSMKLKSISPVLCQNLLDQLLKKGYGKTADEVYSLLNGIFKAAIKHMLIANNPLDIVVHTRHEHAHGKALTKEEEKRLLQVTEGSPLQLMFAVGLYTGLRPNEYYTAKIEGGFIVAVNSKRKNRRVEYKKIPVTPLLKPYLEGVTELYFYHSDNLRRKFRAILPGHKLYDLRTTFYTRCQECGVAEVARDEFVGHSHGQLGDTYTDLSDAFLLAEGMKLNY